MPTIKQKSVVVEIEGGKRIEVRRMRWKPAQEFLQKLATLFVQLYREGKLGEVAAADGVAAKLAALDSIVGQLPTLITSSEELIKHLATQSTDLSASDFDELDVLAGSEVLNAALELNTGDELKNSLAGIVQKLGALLPAKKAAPATTS